MKSRRLLITGIVLVFLISGGMTWWTYFRTPPLVGFASGNGRLEAREIDIASKFQGRIAEVLAYEGDVVNEGQVVGRMDTKSLEAQLREAEAKITKAQKEKAGAHALVDQRESEYRLTAQDLDRSRALYERRNISRKELDRDRTAVQTAKATIAQAQAQVAEAEASVQAAIAETERIKVDLEESILIAPRRGRILYRLAEPGEVLSVGGKVLTLIDLTDVYMTIFLPETVVGKVAIGAEARIVPDAFPNYVAPAKVSFVSAKAQFTPKQVETRTEREKLMFRIKVQVNPQLLKKHETIVKTGLPGVAYVRLDPAVPWPTHLQVKTPP